MLRRSVVIAAALWLVWPPHEATAQEGARRDEEQPEKPPPQPVLTKKPVLIEAAPPVYPPGAAADKKEAVVSVRLHIDATGAVTQVDVVEPVGDGFDEAAVAAAKQYRFEAAEFDGKPAPIVVQTRIHFVFEEPEKPVEEPPPPPPDSGRPIETGPPSHGGDMKKPISIEGTALERGTRRKLAGVIVSVTQLGLDVVTDESGRFYFHGVPPGDYEVVAVDDRFDRFHRTLKVGKNEAVTVKLYLRPKGGNPYETVVEGEREVIEVTRRTIERQQMTSVPGTFGDPIRVIQTLPGLARTPFVTGFLLIRGSNPDDSGVFIDGHRIPLLFHFLGGPSVLNAEFLEQINLYPGGFPARFGRAIGGIVGVETRSAKSDGVHGSADIDLLDAGGYVRFPIGKDGALAFAGRRSYLDFMLGFFLPEPDPGDTLIVVPVYYDYQARLDWDFHRDGKASVFLIGSSDRLDVLSESADDEESFDLNSAIRFFRVIGSYKRPFVGDLDLTISPAFGKDSVGFGGSQADAASDFTSVDVSFDTLSYRMRINGPLAPHVLLDTGIDMESRVTHYQLLVPDDLDFRAPPGTDITPTELDRNVDIFGYGLHADVALDVGKLRVIPGFRVDGFVINGDSRLSFDPRLVVRYQLNDAWTPKGYIGLFHQPPQPEAADPTFGNPAVDVEQALHVGLGAEWKASRSWSLDGEVYFIDRRNLVVFTDEVVVDPVTGNPDPVVFANLGVGDTYGLELLVRHEVTRNFFGWLSYTLSSTRVRRQPGDDYMPHFFDQRHTLNAVASYRTNGGWEFGGRLRLATGRPDTPILGGTFDADSGGYIPAEGENRSIRRDTFVQVDSRAEYTWLFDTWRFGIYLDIQNVFNFENEEATQYDYRYRDSAPVSGVPFLPTIGLRGQF